MSDRAFERAVHDWLAAGSDRTSPAAIDAVLLAVKTTPQERDFRVPRRFRSMPALTRATALAAVAAVIAVGGWGVLYLSSGAPGRPVTSPTPASTPTGSSTATISTADWRPYYSGQGDFTISYPPAGWTVTPATRSWDMTVDRAGPPPRSDGAENFYNAEVSVGADCCGLLVSVFKVYFEGYSSGDEFLDLYLPPEERQPCDRVDDAAPSLSVDNKWPAVVIQLCDDVQAFVFGRNDVYVIAGWRRDAGPWVRAFLSTFHVGATNPDTSTWTPFSSTRYGYQLAIPPGWEATPASRDWRFDEDRADWLAVSQDSFVDKDAPYQIGLFGFAADVPSGTTAEQWIDAFYAGNPDFDECPVRATELPATVVDGVQGRLADQQECSDEMAFVLAGRRMYVFKIGREAQWGVFEGFLSTVRLP